MFPFNKKIRLLAEALDKGAANPEKLPKELKEAVHAVKNAAPDTARPHFRNHLKQQLLLKHKTMPKSHPAPKKEKPAPHQWFAVKGFAFAMAMLLVVAVSGIVSYPLIPAPQVEGYALRENKREISYNAPIKVVFSQPMDRASVEQAFHIEPTLEGKFEWSGNTMLFKPTQEFEVGKTYAVTVEKKAKSLFQKPLTYDYEENFEITGSPRILLFNPAHGSEFVPVESKITVLFDRPMTALAGLDKGETVFPKIKIEPAVKGRFKWLGTSSVTFIPEKLAYSTHYTVTIPKGTTSAEGGLTDEDFIYTFSTPGPAIMQTLPYDMDRYNGPDTKVRLDFNQPMDPGKAKASLHFFISNDETAGANTNSGANASAFLADFDASKWTEVPFTVRNLTAADISEGRDRILPYSGEARVLDEEEDGTEIDASVLEKSLVLVPSSKLSYKSRYFVKIDKGLGGKEGTFALAEDQGIVFTTVGDIEVTGSHPSDGQDLEKSSADDYYGYLGAAEINFSHPMDIESLSDKVTVSPLKKDKDTGEVIKPNISGGPDNSSLVISYAFEPSTEYTIDLKAGGKDMFGQTMAAGYSFKFKTAALKPAFELVSRSDLSILDINKTPIYYLKSTNVDQIHFNFKRLEREEFNRIYTYGYLNYGELTNIGGDFSDVWDITVKGEFNKETVTPVDFNADGVLLTPGIYYFDVTSPQVFNEYEKRPKMERQVFVITGTGLAVKRSNEELLAWAHSLKDGAPSAGLDITVTDREGKQVASGKTDKDGLATIALPKPSDEADYYSNDYTVSAEKDGDYTMVHTTWSDGVDPWNFNITYDPFQPDYYVYSYTDRPIYRPGHTVYFKGLVRKDADAAFKLPDTKTVHVSIKDSQYESVLEKDFTLNANGTYSGEYTLGDNVRTGSYTIETTIPGATGPEYLNKFYTYFRIAEYRKPDYELNLKPDKETYINGDKAKIKVKGAYFFGAPMPNAPVEYTVKSQDYYFFIPYESDSPYSSAWYSFSDEGYSCYWGCEGGSEVVTSGKGKLDANGEFTIDLPLSVGEKKISQIYTIEATVQDLNNQSVSNRANLTVNAGEYYLGILNEDYVVSQSDPMNFDVISVDEKGMPVPNKSVEVSLYKRSWNTVKKKNLDSDFYYENSYEDLFVEKKSVKTDDKGHATVSFTAKEGGLFKATAAGKDGKGNEILASTTVYVTSSTFLNWGRENNDKIELVPDKMEYKPGETAKILIKSPYTDVWALVTQERQNIIDKRVIKLTSNSETIEVPITEKSLPNVFVSVLLVKGSSATAGLGEPAPNANDEREVAAFKMGYVTLQVNTESRKMDISVETDQPKYHPGDEITIKVKTADAAGKPVPAEVSVAVVDKSVLSLTETVTADLLNAFYRKRWLGVMTAETLTKAISRVNVQVEAGLKGGGGGGPTVRGVFKDTAFWKAEVNTDANGNGEVKFKLPDNLTTWQVLAIGIDKNTLVGSQKTEFLVTKDVLVRAVLPRFLIVNDTLNAGGIVHNYMDKTMEFDVSLEATGVEIIGSKSTRIRLKSGEEKKVEWPVKATLDVGATSSVEFKFSALAAGDNTVGDVLEQKLPIAPYSFPEIVATSGTINDDKKHVETVWLPVGVDPKFGELTLAVAPTLAGSISQGLEYLMTFPYGCVEQTTSSLLPNAVIKQVLSLPALKNTLVDQKELQKNVEAGVAALYKYQLGNGAWGIWQTSEANPYLTAYVIYTLDQVQKAGYTVDENVIKRGRDYLTSYMNGNQITKPADTANAYEKSQYREQVNLRAYIMFVLAETGKGDLALSNNLYDYRRDLNIFSKAYLAMAFKTLGEEEKAVALKNDILMLAKETPRGVHFEETQNLYRFFDTNGRTTALVLQMLARVDAENPYIPKILRHLLMEKKDGRYQSTQETAVTLIAFVEYLKNSRELEPSYNAVVTAAGAEKLNKSYTEENVGDNDVVRIALTELLPDNSDNEITFARTGVGNMYYDMNLKYFLPTEQIKPRDEGVLVTQEYFRTTDAKMETVVASAPAGENLKGRMTVIVPEDRYYVMVEDYLPAGLEGVDFDLKTSQMGLQDMGEPVYGKGGYGKGYYDYSMWAFNYSEVRDDRMMFFADYLPKGVYEIEYFVRATTPGTYHDLPALAQELYFPEVFGRSEGKMFEVSAGAL